MKSAVSAFWIASLISVGISLGALSTQSVHSQDLRASSQDLVAEENWMNVYYDLEYAMRELMWHQSMSVLASYGEYNSYLRADGGANANDLRRLVSRIDWNKSSIAAFKRALRRSGELPEEDVARTLDVVEIYGKFLAAAENVAALLEESESRAANLAYRDSSVPLSKKIGENLYNLRRAAQDRFQDHAKNIR